MRDVPKSAVDGKLRMLAIAATINSTSDSKGIFFDMCRQNKKLNELLQKKESGEKKLASFEYDAQKHEFESEWGLKILNAERGPRRGIPRAANGGLRQKAIAPHERPNRAPHDEEQGAIESATLPPRSWRSLQISCATDD